MKVRNGECHRFHLPSGVSGNLLWPLDIKRCYFKFILIDLVRCAIVFGIWTTDFWQETESNNFMQTKTELAKKYLDQCDYYYEFHGPKVQEIVWSLITLNKMSKWAVDVEIEKNKSPSASLMYSSFNIRKITFNHQLRLVWVWFFVSLFPLNIFYNNSFIE